MTRWCGSRRISPQRYPLVDGQGNFGNIDGDNAAAMRYTEARLTEVARLLLDGIDEDAVDFRPTYDGTDEEPVVLPAAFPTCWPTARRASRSAWRPRSRRTMPPSCATPRCILIDNPNARSRHAAEIRARARISRPAASSSIRRRRSPKPTRPAAARSACARAGKRKTPAAAPIVIVITEIPWLVQKSRLVEQHRRTDQREEAAAGRRRARRIGRRHAAGDRAARRARSMPSC